MSNFPIDAQGHWGTTLDSFQVEYSRPGAFVGGTANARGDYDGTSNPTTIFTVTGDVVVRVFAVCTVTLVGAATIEVGVTGNTAKLLAQVSDATTIAAGDVWVDGTVNDVRAALLGDVTAAVIVTNSSDIIETLGTANVTAGSVYYVALWRPLSDDGRVVGLS